MRRFSDRLFVLVAVLAVGALGCDGGDGGGGGDDGGADDGGGDDGGGDDGGTGSRWTVFVYGHADHNLSASLVMDMAEMQRARFGENVRVVVLADYDASSQNETTGMAFPAGSTWLRITPGAAAPEVLAEEPEQDLDDPGVLAAAVARAFRENPADRRGLVMWNHGGAWNGGFGSDSQDGTRASPPGITIEQLRSAIGAGLVDAGVAAPIDFLAFDTCLMAGPEVIYALRSLSRVYFANAELDYGAGWDYEATLSWIGDNPAADVRALATNEVLQWDAHHRTAGPEDTELRTHVAMDLSRSEAFGAAMQALVTAWTGSASFSNEEAARAAFRALPGYNNLRVDAVRPNAELRDLGQFLDGLSGSTSDPAVASAATEARRALGELVVATSLGSRRTSQAGVHIELPDPRQIGSRIENYRAKAGSWTGATGWDRALERLGNAADAVPPALEVTGENTVDPDRTTPTRSRVRSAAADVAGAYVYLAALDGNLLTILALEGAGNLAPDEEVMVEWDGGQYVVAGQRVTVMPFVLVDATLGDLPILSIPVDLADSDDIYEGALVVDGDDGAILGAAIYVDDDQPSFFDLVELGGATITPVLPSYDLDTDMETITTGTAIPIPEDGSLVLEYADAPAGTYYVLTEVVDVWGNSAIDGFEATIN